MAIELHHLNPSHDEEVARLKARIAELEKENAELKEAYWFLPPKAPEGL